MDPNRKRAVLRFVLGHFQMFGAVLAATLLIGTGVSAATFIAFAATSVVTLTNLLLFRTRRCGRW